MTDENIKNGIKPLTDKDLINVGDTLPRRKMGRPKGSKSKETVSLHKMLADKALELVNDNGIEFNQALALVKLSYDIPSGGEQRIIVTIRPRACPHCHKSIALDGSTSIDDDDHSTDKQ